MYCLLLFILLQGINIEVKEFTGVRVVGTQALESETDLSK